MPPSATQPHSQLLTVGGGLGNSPLSISQKHPIILHGKDPLMHQLVRSKHLSMLHAGMTLLLATLDRTLHIIGARRLVRTITRSCITCRKVSARTEQHIMGQLPQRVSPSSPFTTQASNLLAHLPSSKPVLIKAYVCLFISFSTKAVHLEVVSDLITAAFTTSLHHFIS